MLKQHEIDFIAKKAKNYKPSKQAFSCMKGKGCSREKCPAWVDIQWDMVNKETGDKVSTPLVGCQFILNPIFTADMVSTMYRGIDTTDRIVKGYDESNKKLQNIVEESNKHTGIIKQGVLALLKLVGAKDIQRVMIENEELRNKLEERQINQIESNTEKSLEE